MTDLYIHKNSKYCVYSEHSINWTSNIAHNPCKDKPILKYYTTIGEKIIEDESGNIFVEMFYNKKYDTKSYYIISSDIYKSKHSKWVKRYRKE